MNNKYSEGYPGQRYDRQAVCVYIMWCSALAWSVWCNVCVQVLRRHRACWWAGETLSEKGSGGLRSGPWEMGRERSAILRYFNKTPSHHVCSETSSFSLSLSRLTCVFRWQAHLLTLLFTPPSWSLMEGSWGWTYLTEVTWHTASWQRRRKFQRLPSSLSLCPIRYETGSIRNLTWRVRDSF